MILERGESVGDVAFCVRHRLLAPVPLRHFGEVGLGDLDVVAKDFVVAHLQRLDARALPFLFFQAGQILPGIFARLAQFIQLQ